MKKVDLVKEEIIQDYINGSESGKKLPSENALAKQYNVHRHTVRSVLNSLKVRGLINSEHGSGWYVNPTSSIVNNDLTSSVIHDKNVTHSNYYRILLSEHVQAQSYHQIFNCSKSRILGKFKRIQYKTSTDMPIRYEETIYNRSLVPDLTDQDLCTSFTKALLRNNHTLQIKESKIFTMACPSDIAHHLNLPPNAPVLGVLEVSYDQHHVVAVYSFSIHANSTLEIVYSQFN